MPLFGTQQFLFAAFEKRMRASDDLTAKWDAARQMNLIKEEFPDLWFTTEYR
jgi:hypothetical protein